MFSNNRKILNFFLLKSSKNIKLHEYHNRSVVDCLRAIPQLKRHECYS